MAKSIFETLQGVTYTPCRVEVPAELDIRAGDIVTVTDSNGKTITMYVMTKTQAGQRDTLECTGSPSRDSSTAANEQSYQALSGKVLELHADVEGLRAENRDAAGNLASLALTVDGIQTKAAQQADAVEGLRQQVSTVEQTAQAVKISVEKLENDGASKVKTAMGYTFDDTGLRITRDGQQMENRLDNTGMYVERAGQTILQASSSGVVAVDVQVRNYLCIGDHARLEDYTDGTDNKRTACFFTAGSA